MSKTLSRLVITGALVGAALVAPPAVGNRFRDNPDRVVDRKTETWTSPIGELEQLAGGGSGGAESTSKLREMGTGFLVSPCYILSAEHVPFGKITPTPGKNYEMRFHVGVSNNSPFEGNTLATPVAWGNTTSSGENDIALLKLKACIGKRPELGWFELSTKSAAQLIGTRVEIAGYATDRARGQLSIGPGTIRGVDRVNNLIMTDASAAPGQSGGPTLAMESGVRKVVGVYAGTPVNDPYPPQLDYNHFSADHANEFVALQDFLKRADVRSMLEADIAGAVNPAVQRQMVSSLPK